MEYIVYLPLVERLSKRSPSHATLRNQVNKQPTTNERRDVGLIKYTSPSSILPPVRSIRLLLSAMHSDIISFEIYKVECDTFDNLYILLSLYFNSFEIYNFDEIVYYGQAVDSISKSIGGLYGNPVIDNENIFRKDYDLCTHTVINLLQYKFPSPLIPKE